jgi:ribose transport system ATP-binding protein
MAPVKPKVLLLDEPTQGVDVHAKATIHALAREAAANGSAVVIASSDDVELCDACDRVLVMRDGRIAGEVRGDRRTPEEIGRLQLGTAPRFPASTGTRTTGAERCNSNASG